jgi:PIN domain nuclease of toxin-antitoxin system
LGSEVSVTLKETLPPALCSPKAAIDMGGWVREWMENRSQLKQTVSNTRKSDYLSSSAAASDLERNQSAMTLRPPPPTRTWMEAVWGICYLHGEDVDSQSTFLRSKLRRIDKPPFSLSDLQASV